jgi:hypothetical protein
LGAQEEDKRKKKHNTICVGHYYAQADAYYVSKTCTLLQKVGGKDEPSIIFCFFAEIVTDMTTM